jgi:hypothetical protein
MEGATVRRISWAAAFLALSMAMTSLGVVGGATPASAAMPTAGAAEVQFLGLLNQARTASGLAPVVRDGGLDGVARAWSNHMAAIYLVTGDPVVKATSPNNCQVSSLCHRPDLVAAVGAVEPRWQLIGENIGVGGSVESLHSSLWASSGHRANILGNYNRVGIGVVVQGTRIWVTFDFLRGPAISGTTGTDRAVPVPAAPNGPVVPLQARTRFNPLSPTRFLDTRSGVGGYRGLLGRNVTLRLKVAGRAGVPIGAGGVAVNITATGSRGTGFLTAYPCGSGRPTTSNLNVTAGGTRANLSVVALDHTGELCIFTSVATHVLADLAGWYGNSGGSYRPVTPVRLTDTRAGGRLVQLIAVPLSGRVPADTIAVTLNVTVTAPVRAGFVTVYPCGWARPTASNLNYAGGRTVPNLVTVKVGTGMRVCVYSSAPTHVLVDLAGSYGGSGTTLTTSVPDRFLDTRNGDGGWLGAVAAWQRVELPVGGAAGIPAGATAAVLNVTVTGARGSGYLVAYPCDSAVPNTSNLNFVTGETVPNLVVVRLASSGRVCISSSTRTFVLADLAGWFTN